MLIQLKNVRVNEGLSRESLAFSATLYINGQRVGLITNDGTGGETNYQSFDGRGAAIIQEAVKWVGSFPRRLVGEGEAEKTTVADQSKFRVHIEDMANTWWKGREDTKFRKKAEKAMETGIVFGVRDLTFRVMKYRQPIATLIRSKMGVERLRLDIHSKVLPMLGESEKILNSNIPLSIVRQLKVPSEKWIERYRLVDK